ncbi:arabinosyltransferase domain-containing protein [Prauserella cavernicola]|uniref:Arabinosyltransferase domain-containing protein n=1 Tax=Prauserella cavernicola TaxID=2800127 RepID=A0A934QLN1_9PSEU|nr:arabinosyltransferase domain-containing protein [Prauserella cavernicola]MBK1783217.1 arabinosyltransferase domain-containing protein [Prauserella cavernicola]
MSEESSRRRRVKLLGLLASIVGVLSAILAIAIPLLPVNQDVTTLEWPTQEGTRAVTAPLTAQAPVQLEAEIPCSAAADLDRRTSGPATLVSTNAPDSEDGRLTGLALRVDSGLLTFTTRGQQLGSAPVGPGDCTITIRSDASGTSASIGDEVLAAAEGDYRPQVTGIYSDLDANRDAIQGLSVSVEVDNRWDTTATVIKWIAIALSVTCFVIAMAAVYRLDHLSRGKPPRLAPKGWWKPRLLDLAVVGTLVVWWLIGAMTADDGYFLTMARVRDDAGYIGEYYRWYGTADSPLAWFVDLYAAMTHVSTLAPWMRLPSLLMGIVSWLLISREVLPRLGQQVRRSNAAAWAAGAVFLAFWLPYDNGLRPENIVAVLSLITLCAVERAVATRRMLPALLGLTTAALSVATNPHGLMAVLPFIVAGKPLLKMVRRHARQFGWLPILASIAAAGFVILNLVFYDQTLGGALSSTDLRTAIGPNQSWHQELARYTMLFTDGADGSMTRRFPVLLVLLCLATCAVVLLRRGIIRGAALGPSRRLLAMSALSFVVLALTPTKHSHHFGMLATIGGALAALTALATSTNVLSSRRNRAGFTAALLLIAALASTGPNAWWYVSGWGVPWYDIPPQFMGIPLSTMLLVAAAVAFAVAVVEHMKHDEHKPYEPPPRVESRSRALRLGAAPLSIVCAVLVLFEIGSIGKATVERWNTYSSGTDNAAQLIGQSCGLSDYVYVEQDPLRGVLSPSPDQPNVPAPGWETPEGTPPELTPERWLEPAQEGFYTGEGLPERSEGQSWQPPYGLGGSNAPVWGSYEPTGNGTGQLRTEWYPVPQRALDGDVPVVVAVAGQLDGPMTMTAEFGRDTPEGFEVVDRREITVPSESGWRDARITVDGAAKEADRIRIVAEDNGLGPDAWLAFSAPRVPALERMTDVVGDTPTFLEWAAAFQHPCLSPSTVINGVAEMPEYRVSAGGSFRDIGESWSSPKAGGPFGWINVTTRARELPTYLKGDYNRDWGSLYKLEPYEPDALPPEAAEQQRTVTRSGMWSPGDFVIPAELHSNVTS